MTPWLERGWKFLRPWRGADEPGQPMVSWFSPDQLLRTGIDVILSLVFAKRADYRLLEALGIQQGVFPHDDRDEIWIDYAADVGDGFNSTYEIARQLAKREIAVQGTKTILPRGRILILGGDQVYPTPTEEAYRDRLLAPYEMASRRADGEGRLYALPGNHDWYDGLVAFMGTFCTRRQIGLWKNAQSRSYFALKLPHGWWLLGVDTQLGSDIDTPQIEYFRALEMKKGDRAILCTAEPHWVYGNIYDPEHHTRLATLIEELKKKEVQVPLQIAGDLHHYRRFTEKNGASHLITAGGGGAFLHPTHTNNKRTIRIGDQEFERGPEFPSAKESWLLGWLMLFFLPRNLSFGIVSAIGYVALSWIMPTPDAAAVLSLDPMRWVTAALRACGESGLALAWVAAIIAGFVLFTDTHKRGYRLLAGSAHGALHLWAAMLISAWANTATNDAVDVWVKSVTAGAYQADLVPFIERLLSSCTVAIGGLIAGPFIMGLYLFVSVTIFGRHSNEAFSALRIEGYRNFLRIKIDRTGLTLHALGLRTVPWRWEMRGNRWEPAAPCTDQHPELLDQIEIHP